MDISVIAVIHHTPVALYEASQTLQKAEQAKAIEEMDHLAYMAETKVQIAVALVEQKKAESERELLIKEKDRIILEAREYELKQVRREAEIRARKAEQARKEAEAKALELAKAKGEAETLARQAEKARKDAEAKALEIQRAKSEAEARAVEIEQARKEAEARALELEKGKREAEARALEAEKGRLETGEIIAQRKQLESELAELKAKQTDRGMILTLGDILFEVDKDALMPGAMRTISTGSDTYNLSLSQRRADAVRDALISRGVGQQRIAKKGYGEKYPIASNANPAGRRQNRRVEVLILEQGVSPEKMLR